MRVLKIFLLWISTTALLTAIDIGAAWSVDYYYNSIEDSAGSQIQQRPVIFYNLDSGFFNLRTGLGITGANYEVSDDMTPVFNDMYSGFYTIELDLFAYPGFKVNINEKISIGLSAGGGVRLPVLTGYDDDVSESDVDDSFEWFYSDMRFLYWGGGVFVLAKLPLSETTRFYGNIYYKDFIFRDDQWVIGATAGLVWHLD